MTQSKVISEVERRLRAYDKIVEAIAHAEEWHASARLSGVDEYTRMDFFGGKLDEIAEIIGQPRVYQCD
jgi:hypothetical protein